MPKVSIIVPVYNAEKSLQRCIESILAQTFTDFELILVNDGSTDSSGKICDEYAQKDSRIIVFHNENRGVSCARNKGIDIAKGYLVSFVDSDDYLSENFIIDTYCDCVDLAICNIQSLGHSSRLLKFDSNKVITKDQIANWILENSQEWSVIATPWAKLYRSKIIKTHNIRFNIKLKYGEDTDFVYRYLTQCTSLKLTNSAVYYYSHASSIHQSIKYKLNAIEFCQHINTLYNSISSIERKFNKKYTQLRKRIYLIYFIAFNAYLNSSDINQAKVELKTLRKNIISNWIILYSHRKFCSIKEFFYFFLIIFFPFLYKYLKK